MTNANDKVVPLQDDKWDAAVASMPAMKCGRLDMATWSGDGIAPATESRQARRARERADAKKARGK